VVILSTMTKSDSNEPVTKGMLDEAVSAILQGMDKMFGNLREEMGERFVKVEEEIRGVKVELSHVKDEIKGLKANLSVTPSRKEFEQLKTRVDKHHPLS
jgi:uncharacterized coiled-coil DUF342 family protein